MTEEYDERKMQASQQKHRDYDTSYIPFHIIITDINTTHRGKNSARRTLMSNFRPCFPGGQSPLCEKMTGGNQLLNLSSAPCPPTTLRGTAHSDQRPGARSARTTGKRSTISATNRCSAAALTAVPLQH